MNDDAIYVGNMDRRISVIKQIRTKDETGADTKTDETIVECWAQKVTASSDKVLDEKVVALNVVVFQCHWHPKIVAENMQALFIREGGGDYEIYGVEEIGRRKYLKLKTQYRE